MLQGSGRLVFVLFVGVACALPGSAQTAAIQVRPRPNFTRVATLGAQGGQPTSQAAPDTAPPAVNPGRPTLTDPAALTAPGWLEGEFGLTQNLDRDRNFGTPLLLKYTTFNKRLQYRLENDGYLKTGENRIVGIGDTNVALQYLFAEQSHAGFDIAGRLNVKLPTARAELGTQRFDYSALFLASRDFSPSLHGDFNIGITAFSRSGSSAYDMQTFLSASFTVPFHGGRWAYTNEVTYFSPIPGQRAQVTTMHGFTHAVHRYDVYDIAVQWGLFGDGPVFQLLLGRTFYFARLF